MVGAVGQVAVIGAGGGRKHRQRGNGKHAELRQDDDRHLVRSSWL